MSLGKKELIISIVALVVFAIISVNVAVLATNTGTIKFDEWTSGGTNTDNNQSIDIINTVKDGETNTNVNLPANNTNASGNLAKTGLEDELPWLVIVLCGVSAIFAYKKIKDYNNID